jgi:hypothetical protein
VPVVTPREPAEVAVGGATLSVRGTPRGVDDASGRLPVVVSGVEVDVARGVPTGSIGTVPGRTVAVGTLSAPSGPEGSGGVSGPVSVASGRRPPSRAEVSEPSGVVAVDDATGSDTPCSTPWDRGPDEVAGRSAADDDVPGRSDAVDVDGDDDVPGRSVDDVPGRSVDDVPGRSVDDVPGRSVDEVVDDVLEDDGDSAEGAVVVLGVGDARPAPVPRSPSAGVVDTSATSVGASGCDS